MPFSVTKNPKNYSFVVQGPIYIEYTHHTINSIKKHYPGSEIIISTWPNQNLSYIDTSDIKVLINNDPGPDNWNLSRQIISSYEGIKVATRDIVVKVSSDLLFTSSALRQYIGYWNSAMNSIFNHRIYVGHLDSHKSEHSWLSLSDHMYCGLHGDMLRLFSIPLPDKTDDNGPERYITKGWVERCLNPLERSTEASDRVIRDCFCVLHSENEAGYICQKYKIYKNKSSEKLIMGNLDWQKYYYANNTT